MATPEEEPRIDDYLRKRLMPVDSAIPELSGIDNVFVYAASNAGMSFTTSINLPELIS